MHKHFPNDITIDILLKLPVKSLLRFKKVGKSWCSLIEDRHFIKQCYYQKIFVILRKDKCFSIDAPLQHDSDISIIKPPQEINYPLSKIFVNSCNGLFLLVLPRSDKIVWWEPTLKQSDKIILWNPALRQSRTIPCPIHTTKEYGMYCWVRCFAYKYVLGYVSSLGDYKIVRIDDGAHVQIFSTKSNSWKLIRNLPKGCYKIHSMVVADGIAYIYYHEQSILCLCLKNENYEEILFPDPDITSDNVTLHTAGDCLLAMFPTNNPPNNMVDYEVWYMKKNGMRYSWSKTLAITVPLTKGVTRRIMIGGDTWIPPVLEGFTKDGDMVFLISKEEIEFLVYDSKTAKCKQVKVGGDEARRKFKGIKITGPRASILIDFGVTYVETLISPNAI